MKIVDIMWHETISSTLQLFMWQLNNGGILVGAWSIYMRYDGECHNKCRFNINESLKPCFMNCRAPEMFWEAICLALASTLTFIGNKLSHASPPWSSAAPATTKIEHAWDVLEKHRYWPIWCIWRPLQMKVWACLKFATCHEVTPSTSVLHKEVKSQSMLNFRAQKMN